MVSLPVNVYGISPLGSVTEVDNEPPRFFPVLFSREEAGITPQYFRGLVLLVSLSPA